MSRKDKDVKEFGPWSEQTSSSGRKYFYNRDTEVSQWEKPKEWRDHELRLEQERLVAEHQRVQQQQQQQQPPVPPPPLFLPPPFPFPPPPPFAPPPPGFRPISTLPPFPPFHPHFQPPPNIPPLPHVLPPRVTTNSASINVSPVASHQSNQIHYTSSHHSSATSYSGSHGLAQSHANNQMNVSGHYRSKQDHGGTHERDRDRPRSEAQNQMHSHSQHIKKEVKENDLTKEEDRKVVAKQVKRERLSTELISSVDETPAKKVKEDKQDVEEWRKYYDEELAKKKRIELNLDVDPEMRDLVALSLTLENKLVAELINVKTAAALVAVQENEVRLCNGKIVSLENQRLDLESRQSRFMTPLQLNMPDLKP